MHTQHKRYCTYVVKLGLAGEPSESKHHDLGQDLVLELPVLTPYSSMEVIPDVAQKMKLADDMTALRKHPPDGLGLGQGLIGHHILGRKTRPACSTSAPTDTAHTTSHATLPTR